MHFVTRAAPIDDIDGKSYKMEVKSSRNYSTNDIKPKSRHKLFMASGACTHACIHTYTRALKVISRNQVCAGLALGLKRLSWRVLYAMVAKIIHFRPFCDIFSVHFDVV